MGRGADGHECRYSDTTSLLSDSDNPGHGKFIKTNTYPINWRSFQNDSLRQGLDGIKNPCPTGYRLPTEEEWEEEVDSWASINAKGAYGSVLKLPMAGFRYFNNASVLFEGSFGSYLSSTASGGLSWNLLFNSSSAAMGANFKAYGVSVRCIKD